MSDIVRRLCTVLAVFVSCVVTPVVAMATPEMTLRLQSTPLGLFDAKGRPYYPQDPQIFFGPQIDVSTLTIVAPESDTGTRSVAKAPVTHAPAAVSRSPDFRTDLFVAPVPRIDPFTSPRTMPNGIMDPWTVGVFR